MQLLHSTSKWENFSCFLTCFVFFLIYCKIRKIKKTFFYEFSYIYLCRPVLERVCNAICSQFIWVSESICWVWEWTWTGGCLIGRIRPKSAVKLLEITNFGSDLETAKTSWIHLVSAHTHRILDCSGFLVVPSGRQLLGMVGNWVCDFLSDCTAICSDIKKSVKSLAWDSFEKLWLLSCKISYFSLWMHWCAKLKFYINNNLKCNL